MYKKVLNVLESNRIPLILFFISLFLSLSFAGTRMFFSDEGVIVSQFYNLVHGNLDLEVSKVQVERGIYITVNDHLYGKFSYSLLILSLPVFFLLKLLDSLYGAHLFLLQLWALSGGIIVYLAAKIWKNMNAAIAGLVSYLVLILINMRYFDSIYFPKWGEVISIEFANILITSFLVLVVYFLFRDVFSNKIAIFASFFVIFSTPISFYSITLKHHSLTVLLTLLAFYYFYKYQEKKDNKLIYYAYVLAGLCVWTRILEGVVLLASLLITDILIFRRSIKNMGVISIIIIISLVPFFSFNQIILGNPFSIMELHPLSDTPMKMQIERNMIVLNESGVKARQVELLDKLGFIWNPEIRTGFTDILSDIMFSKLGNTFGVILVCPFLITAFAFITNRIKSMDRLSAMQKFMGLYFILYIIIYKDHVLSIVTDTPIVLEYRYLLIFYIILLYFAISINNLRSLIEENLKNIALLFVILFVIISAYLIKIYPPPFLHIYYFLSLITAILLIMALSTRHLIVNKKTVTDLLDKIIIFLISLSLVEASLLMLFYYWAVTITYISPSQNYTILPILESIFKWMYQVLL